MLDEHPKDVALVSPQALVDQGQHAFELGDLEGARDLAGLALSVDGTDAEAWLLLARLQTQAGRWDEAHRAAQQAVSLCPYRAEAHLLLGWALGQRNRAREAVRALQRALDIKPDYYGAADALALVLDGCGEHGGALRHAAYAARSRPDVAEYRNTLGNILLNLNRRKDALREFERCIELDPHAFPAYWNIVRSKTITAADSALIFRVQELYVDPKIAIDNKMMLARCMGKIFRDLGDYEMAFDCWTAANMMQKQRAAFGMWAEKQLFSKLYAHQSEFRSASAAALHVFSPTAYRPIFIVGMPRSGTSLVEQILASHSQVSGLGELGTMAACVSDAMSAMDAGADPRIVLSNIREHYLEEVVSMRRPKRVFTDKMPTNFRFIGWIAEALPEAKIVHTVRDGPAVCFSNFVQYFASVTMHWSCDLGDIVEYYKLYREWMEFARTDWGERIFDLRYEELVEDQEGVTRALLAHCDLPFEPQCLEFHKNGRVVNTASQQQVQQPIYKGSSREWQKYSAWLKPMLAKLSAVEELSSSQPLMSGKTMDGLSVFG